jgi:general L-amino acid transport system ATP-binding protein
MREEMKERGTTIISCKDVHKWFDGFHALKGISMDVKKGEVIVIFGPSGSGKSTFIRTINRLEEHQRGQIIVDNVELSHDVRNVEKVRMETGMVFQQFNLFPHLTVMQNITLAPIWVRKWPKDKAEQEGLKLLERVGIPEQADKFPGQLSGGQQQRVAIARALATQPKIVLADEPTANLDHKTGEDILRLMKQLNHEEGTTFIFSTHDARVMEMADRVIELADGQIMEQET